MTVAFYHQTLCTREPWTKKSTLQNVICDTFVSAESICHVLVRVELPWEKYLVMDQNLFTDHVT